MNVSLLNFALVFALLAFGPGCFSPDKSKKTVEIDSKKVELGKELFAKSCVACHGPAGKGDGPAAAAMKEKPRDFHMDEFKFGDTRENIFKTVSEGIKGTPMPAWGHLPDGEKHALVEYVFSIRAKRKSE